MRDENKKRILVTGGAGFVGSHLIHALLDEGHDIVCVDNMNDYYDPTLKKARLALFQDKVTFYQIDISDMAALEDVFKKHQFDAIAHLAAQAGVRYSLEAPLVYVDSNVRGTVCVFECAQKYGVKNIVMASSSSVYGSVDGGEVFSEDREVNKPISVYAATKRATELLAYTYHHLYGLNITSLRFFTAYGPYGRPDMALFKFVSNMLADKPIDVYGDGNQERDFTYVSDIVSGFVLALKKPLGFSILNLGAGNPISLNMFIAVIEEVLGKKAQRNALPAQPGDVPRTSANIRKAAQDLGYKPEISIKEGVEKFVQWYKKYYEAGPRA